MIQYFVIKCFFQGYIMPVDTNYIHKKDAHKN